MKTCNDFVNETEEIRKEILVAIRIQIQRCQQVQNFNSHLIEFDENDLLEDEAGNIIIISYV